MGGSLLDTKYLKLSNINPIKPGEVVSSRGKKTELHFELLEIGEAGNLPWLP